MLGIALTCWIAYDLHFNTKWDWGPGAGKLPVEIVQGFMSEAYGDGRGVQAAKDYFTPDAKDRNPLSADRKDGPPIRHDTLGVVAQGLSVAVHHCISAAGDDPALNAVDIFRTKNGRIVERTRIAQPAASDERCAMFATAR
ncbi:hypothetical protein MB84_08155 [Pandoraea oxalativorans]|uniref:SnoaL-like domain-containing protein n=1 Tax=Pandoraea oxalativorans TaxID=573737 RepID=A0A0E3U9I8_9BURK|nr:hypothetical protein MB84_08155 [Pandoraea oxalativorans]